MSLNDNSALLLIDLQNDFCPGGALGVAGSDKLALIANKLQPYFEFVVASQDWHPDEHLGFAVNHENKKTGDIVDLDGVQQYLWPKHCVQGSLGADFHDELCIDKINYIVQKGTNKFIDSYSAFFDNKKFNSTGLEFFLKQKDIHEIYVMGIATDFCVKYSCLDALNCGFKVNLLVDACCGVELLPGDSDLAIQEMESAGVSIQSIKSLGVLR